MKKNGQMSKHKLRGSGLSRLLFRMLCLDPSLETSPENWDPYFEWRLLQADKFIRRFGGRVNVCDKTVLDFGCGFGSMSFVLAEAGARRVVGVDIDQDRIAFARTKLATDFKRFSGSVDFVLPDEIKDERFDMVISEDCFEHYADPIGIMNNFRLLLGPKGRVVIGFSPLWKSPYGGHISHMTKVPWAHLVFPEHIIMQERMRYRPQERATAFSEMKGGLNKMTYEKFLKTMQESGYKIDFLATNLSENKMMPFVNLVRRLPICFEFFTKNLYAIVAPE
jgi:2-polyprenyl-3-methyl-5-hydroxy-6-metoxy-1,4-benzoquinol methylase